MAIDLLQTDPLALLDAPLPELDEMVKLIEPWTKRHAELLDDAYRGRVAELLTRRGSAEELRELHHHLSIASGLLRTDKKLQGPWAERWNGYAAVLSARIGALATQDPEGVRSRAHVEDILSAVRGAGVQGIAQSMIGTKVGLQKANLARILNLMEANDLIERRPSPKNKREKHIFLGHNAQPDVTDTPATRAHAPRGMSYLSHAS